MVKEEKIQEVENLVSKINNYSTITICDFNGLNSNLFHKIRKNLRGNSEIIVSKNTLIKKAFEKANLPLQNYIDGNTALIFSQMSPFEIYKILKENVEHKPPKPNSIASEDITVKEGDTPFAPGPMVSELQKYGIKAQIKKGKVVITSDSIVVKKGDKIPAGLSVILGKLGINPVEVGLKPVIASDKKTIFTPEILNINIDEYKSKILSAYQNALTLSIEKFIYNEKSIPIILQKAYIKAKTLAVDRNILTKDTIKDLLIKGYMQAIALSQIINL